jgi:hypothetical protein
VLIVPGFTACDGSPMNVAERWRIFRPDYKAQ